ncbi:MAG: hypothetical protein ZNDK_0900 [Candidatus Desulfovibrio kirbyi]|uniref:SLATT domain-containing protein n=1 Tax=Candidatus Desulfovibrio kirbyi TaxID=2696086 RepID=A0A6L2R6H4_9BACT|nr:MAG: hypothetical protein ZNDK_0900 [Candidatus Desulfovibrio kirbyi]
MSEKKMVEEDKIFALRREAERLEEDVTYSSKSHFNAANIWENTTYGLGIPSTILAALAGAALIKNYPEWASACAMFASLLTGLMTFLKPNERAVIHREVGGRFLTLRNDARFFREFELLQTERINELSDKLKELLTARNELNQKSPSIPRWAFLAARKGIEEGEATYKADKER